MKSKNFQNILNNIYENNILKKGFTLKIKTYWQGCLRGNYETFFFHSNFVYTQNKQWILKKNKLFKQEIYSLYNNLKNHPLRTKETSDYEPSSYSEGTIITLFYENKLQFEEAFYDKFEAKMIIDNIEIYIDTNKYLSANSKDMSNQYKIAFNAIGRLNQDYEIIIEYGMYTKKGNTLFQKYQLTQSNTESTNIAKVFNKFERILRYQKDVYQENKNSLMFINIKILHRETTLYSQTYNSFNGYYFDNMNNKVTKNILKFNDIIHIISRRDIIKVPNNL